MRAFSKSLLPLLPNAKLSPLSTEWKGGSGCITGTPDLCLPDGDRSLKHTTRVCQKDPAGPSAQPPPAGQLLTSGKEGPHVSSHSGQRVM